MEYLCAWILGTITGVLLGVASIALFRRLSRRRSLKHMQLEASLVSMSNMTLSDVKRLFPKDLFPPWIVFGKHEKIDWVDKEVSMAWPFIQEAMCPNLRASMESTLDAYKPSVFTSLKCREFSFGMIPPKVSGVEILKSSKTEISIEVEFQWSGEPIMVLELQTLLGVPISVQIRDVTIAGTLRLTFKPLTDELPCFRAIVYSLRDLTTFNFDAKSLSGNVPAIPGVLNMVEGMIRTMVTDSLIWPMRQVIKILPGDYRELLLHPIGVLHVKLIEARNLLNKDIIGKSDPFALLYIRPIRQRIQRSKTVDNDLSPIWNETFKFEVEDLATQSLFVKVLDEEGVQEPEFLGCAKIALKQLTTGNMLDAWLPLVKDFDMKYTTSMKYRGEIHLELFYTCTNEDMINSLSSTSLPRKSFQRQLTTVEKIFSSKDRDISSSVKKLINPRSLREAIIIRGVLSVMGLRGEQLVLRRPNKALDSFVSLKMKKSKAIMKTKVVPKTFQPEWKENFHMLVEDALHEMLILEVWDHRTFYDRFLGRCVLTLTFLLQGSNGAEVSNMEVNLQGVKSGKLFIKYKWTDPSPLDTQFL